MKCEICHKVGAETVVKKAVAGELQELYVCKACAQLEVLSQKRPEAKNGAVLGSQDMPKVVDGLPLMGMILDAAFEIVGRAMSLAEPTCPKCGITRQEYRKQSRLGCSACYEAFAKELDLAMLELHRSSNHVGKVPAQAKAYWHRQQLEQALEVAVKEQRYEEAICLRDQLRRMVQIPVTPKKGEA